MTYARQLPQLDELCQLARQMDEFPATVEDVIKIATDQGYGDHVLHFLKLFSVGNQLATFQSRAEFYTRAAELAMIICDEREQPAEQLLSPQN